MKKILFIPVVNHFNLLEKAINSVPDGLFDVERSPLISSISSCLTMLAEKHSGKRRTS